MKKRIEFYTDQELDNSSNLYNYDARLYDPVIGRFISPDTIVPEWNNPQSLNRFSYCKNNPLIYIDPSGHFAENGNYPYTAALGTEAHNQIFYRMDALFNGKRINQGSSREYNMQFDRPLNQIWSDLSMNRPDILDKTTKSIIEVKPVTHMDGKYVISDYDQLLGYVRETKDKDYKLGDASNLFPMSDKKGGSPFGNIYDKEGNEYEMRLYTRKDRKGILYYSLKETGRNRKQEQIEAYKRQLKEFLKKGPDPKKLPLPLPWPGGVPVPIPGG